ncbi:hypothetical protein [Hydrogenimonas sp.]
MKPFLLAMLGGVVYYIDKEGRLSSLREEGSVVEYETPLDAADICAGIGGCGNYRIFIADRAEPSLKVFDPLNHHLVTLASLPAVPLGIAKEECTIVVAVEGALLIFDLKRLEFVERRPL